VLIREHLACGHHLDQSTGMGYTPAQRRRCSKCPTEGSGHDREV
jgi:hypothetical protein